MTQKRILLVEDEADMASMVGMNLREEGYQVAACRSGESAIEELRKKRPDLIVLDVVLPKMDGLELCRQVRKKSRIPIIFLSAKQTEEDRLSGLRAGADDYIVKPFSMMEFIARVRGLLRRSEPEGAPSIDAGITIGGIRIDWERHEVWVKGQLSYMTPTEFELLRLLIDADGKVLSRDDLIGRVWGTGTGDGFHTRTVDQHIAGLRRKLGIERERIVTVPNLGYKLIRD